MAKSRAEIQKAYRERKKTKEGETYLEKERKRRMAYYVPTAELKRVDKEKRNRKNRERVRRHREKKKGEIFAALSPLGSPNAESSGYESFAASSSSEPQPMIVRMDFVNNRRPGTRKRISRALSKANREMKHLKNKNEELRRKLRTLQRRNQRSVTKNTNSHSSPQTPRSQAKNDIRNAGLSQRQGDKIRQQLIFGNALISEIRSARKEIGNKKEQVKTLKSIASGKIIKKYRGLNWLSKQTGISRNKLGSGGKSIQLHSKVKRCSVQKRFLSDVTSFLERDDNSRCQPGKADSKKDETGARQQTRVLTDYLDNLHKKFLSENPNIVLSLATFCRMRPKYILLTSFISRSCCLCTKHQNMALILKSVRREGVMVSSNPETYLKECESNPVNFDMLPEKIKLGQWKRITVTEKGKEKSVMRIVESEIEKSKFIDLVIAQTTDFKDHSFRVGKQYNEIKKLKENLPQHQFIIQMDFAENYNCKSVEEIQSAYWNQTSVTLHPVVAYYRNTIGELCHTSYVVVSDELGHSSTTVHAFLDILIPEIKLIDPDVDIIHYWTDSPTSQYRNKQIFYTVANHQAVYGTKARWNYFEVGHGKGPCDGLGGTTKRMADQAVRCGKVVIQDAHDFFQWSINSNIKGVKFLFVSSDTCKEVSERLKARTLSAVRGTFKLHVVVGMGSSTVAFKETSCYCEICLNDNLCENPSWIKQDMTAKKTSKEIAVISIPEKEINDCNVTQVVKVQDGDFVAAVYGDEWFIGQVVQVDQDDEEIEVKFMQKKKQCYQWPIREDIIWVKPQDIICKVEKPVATAKSMRMFKISDDEKDKILNLVTVRNLDSN